MSLKVLRSESCLQIGPKTLGDEAAAQTIPTFRCSVNKFHYIHTARPACCDQALGQTTVSQLCRVRAIGNILLLFPKMFGFPTNPKLANVIQ
jgi:hypothetical protein